MSALSALLGELTRLFATWPLLASILGTALAAGLAALTSIAAYRLLGALGRRLAAGPLFVMAALGLTLLYLLALGALALGGQSMEQLVVGWLTGLTGAPIAALGPGRNGLLLGLFYLGLHVLYLTLVLLEAWALGMLKPKADGSPLPGDEGGIARQVEEELGTSYAERAFKLCGYHRADAPEQRFAEWGRELGRVLRWAKWLSLPAVLTGAIPPSLWVVGAILIDGYRRNLTAPPEAPEEKKREAAQAAEAGLGARNPAQLVQALCQDPRGPKLGLLAGGTLQGRPEHQAGTTRLREESELVKDILRALEIKGFYVHQEAAAEAILAGKDVLMETPPVSGRRTLCDVLAMRTVLLEGGTALYLSPNARESARRAAAFRQLAQRSNWRWAIFHRDLAAEGRQGLDLKLRQPQIVFATPEELHADICPRHADWDFFFRNLGLLVAIDLDRYAGPRGTNLAFVMRRLRRLCQRVGAEPRTLATVAPYGPDVQSFAERLLGRPLTVIGPESNSRGAPTQYVVLGQAPEAPTLHPAISSRGVAIACGYPAEIWGFGDLLSSFELEQQVNKVLLAFNKAVVSPGDASELRFDSAAALAVRMSSADAAMLPFFTCHAGRAVLGVASFAAEEVGGRGEEIEAAALPFSGFERPQDDAPPPADSGAAPESAGAAAQAARPAADASAGAPDAGASAAALLELPSNMVVSIWLPDEDCFARLLARHPNWVHPNFLHPMLKMGASLVAATDNPASARRHLRCAAYETPLRADEAARDFPPQVVAELRARGGEPGERLIESSRLRLTPDGTIEPLVELGLEQAPTAIGSTQVASAETGTVLNRAGGEVVLATDRARLLTTAYPGRVLVCGGRRYRVLMPEEQGRLAEGVAWAEPERRRILTARMREVSASFEGMGHELRLGGGVPVHFHQPAIELRETVLGVRQAHEARGLDDVIRYGEPVRAEYSTRAAVLHLPTASGPALEALELLVRVTLPAFVRHGEDDLDVAAVHGEAPVLLVVDRHPGGVGFAPAITAAVLRHALYWSKQIVDSCGRSARCQQDDGCGDCIGGAPRLSPDDRPKPSRTAVAALLAELLGADPS